MRILMVLLFCCLSAAEEGALPGTSLANKHFELKIPQLLEATLTPQQLQMGVENLNQYIGGYPPSFKSEQQRDEIYEQWRQLVAEAELHNESSKDAELALYLLAELHRQGHNMDVVGSSDYAMLYLDACFFLDDYSLPCNFSAMYFYLSIGGGYLSEAEKSLTKLREHYVSPAM